MRFYTKQHKYYCGIDLHTKKMYVCILDAEGKIRLHQNIKTDPESFLQIINTLPGGCRRGCRVHVHLVLDR